MKYHRLVGKLDQRLGPAQRERSETGAITTDQYQGFGFGHFIVDSAHSLTDFTCPESGKQTLTYPGRVSAARGETCRCGGGDLLNVAGARVVGGEGGRCRVSSSFETWTVHSA